MTTPTSSFWLVVPTAPEIATLGGNITVQVYNSQADAEAAATKAALVAGIERIVVKTIEYASYQITAPVATGQMTALP